MPTHIEQELGLGPIMHRFRRWVHVNTRPDDRISLDPLTVNYAAWEQMRRNVRSWPHYTEAPNSMEILVSPEDWEDYWGVDSARKEEAIAAYVRARAAERGLWIAGDPQILVLPDDAIDIGQVEVVCQFVEPVDGEGRFADDTSPQAPLPTAWPARTQLHVDGRDESAAEDTREWDGRKVSSDDWEASANGAADGETEAFDAQGSWFVGHRDETRVDDWDSPRARRRNDSRMDRRDDSPRAGHHGEPLADKGDEPGAVGHPRARRASSEEDTPRQDPPTMRFVDEANAGEVALVGEGNFRLVLRSGDCIGAVSPGESVPPEVNVRLDAEGFPYVDAKQCTIAVHGGRWTITNHSPHGTCLITREGERLMLGEPEPYPLAEGDVVVLGTQRRLRFELCDDSASEPAAER